MREEHEGRYQMLWDCPFCGTERLLGLDHRHCPACGAAQDPARRYFPKDEERVAVADHPYHGADRVCPSCSTPNGGKSEFCGNCGTALDEAAAARQRAAQAVQEGQSFAADSARAAAQELSSKRPSTPPPPPPPPASSGLGKKVAGAGCCLGLVALAALLLVALLWKKEALVEVSGHRWERTITIEVNRAVSESGWKEDAPRGANGLQCREKEKSTKKVEDGEECEKKRVDKGDGTYDQVKECHPKYRSEPVMGDWCTWTAVKWTTDHVEKVKGDSPNDPPRWPEATPHPAGDCEGCQRKGAKSETYTVLWKGDGESFTCDLPEKKWASFKVGSKWKAKVGVIAGGIDCDAVVAR